MKQLLIYLWDEIGMPGAWVLLMLSLIVREEIYGATLVNKFWIAICLIANFLSRIARAIESLKT